MADEKDVAVTNDKPLVELAGELLFSGNGTDDDADKAHVACTVDYTHDGNVHVIFPQTVDISKMRRTASGNWFIALRGPMVDFNITQQVAGGDPKERPLTSYGFNARMNFKLK